MNVQFDLFFQGRSYTDSRKDAQFCTGSKLWRRPWGKRATEVQTKPNTAAFIHIIAVERRCMDSAFPQICQRVATCSPGKFAHLCIGKPVSHNDRMAIEPSECREPSTIRHLFPELNDSQLHAVQETLHSYLNALWQIYERLRRERPEVFDSHKRPS